MNKNLKAADDVRRLLRGFAGLAEAADAFEQVGQLEQARDEAQAALTALRGDIEKAKGEVADAKAEAKKLKDQAKGKLDEAEARAAERLAAAKLEAERIEREARDAAGVALALAQENVTQAKALADVEIAKRDAAVQELADLEAKITRAQAKIADILKG